MTRRLVRNGMTLIEGIVALSIGLIVMAGAMELYRFGVITVGATVTPQVGLQMASRKALVDLITQVQECSEVEQPVSGSTLNYFLCRDKLNQLLLGYQVQNAPDSAACGIPIYDLMLYTYDYGQTPSAQAQIKLLSGIERMTFTTLSPGLLQVNVQLYEQGKDYSLLTAIRLRNILTEASF